MQETPQIIEVFSGTARLTAAFQEQGIPAIGVDWMHNRHAPEADQIMINMSTDGGLGDLLRLAGACGALQLMWFDAPAGTTSRSRDIPGRGKPGPLRSAEQPRGLDSLGPEDEAKVAAANRIYLNIIKAVKWCRAHGVKWVVGNPGNSYLWYIPEFIDLLDNGGAFDIEFHACMVGGRRDKWLRLRTNSAEIKFLHEKWCDKQHTHAPWREDGAALEAEYSKKFCKMVAERFKQKVQGSRKRADEGFAVGALAAAKRPRRRTDGSDRKGVGVQPRLGTTKQFVPEYADVRLVKVAKEEMDVALTKVTKDDWLADPIHLKSGTIPSGTRILDIIEGAKVEDADVKTKEGIIKYGVAWSPEEFTERAAAVGHPFDGDADAADRIKAAMFRVLTSGVSATRAKRRAALRHWTARAEALQQAELDAFRAAHPAVQPCWGNRRTAEEATAGEWSGKRTCLFKEMAEAAGVPNADMLVSYLRNGAPVFGEVPASGLYQLEESLPDKTFAQVLSAGKWAKPQIRATMRPDPDSRVDREITDRTREEVQEGKAVGPFTEYEVDRRHGKSWTPARRVGLKQASGLRPIDDFSEFGHNGTSHTHERIDLATIDVCVGMVKELFCMVDINGVVKTTLRDGTVLCGAGHEDFRTQEKRGVVGRTLDLKRAYKQIAPAPSMASLSIVAIWDSREEGVRYYELRALPFGARNAVYSCGSMFRSLEIILVNLFDVITGQYVDDFPKFELKALVGEEEDTMVQVLRLLGWEIKLVDGEIPAFASSFHLLGVAADLANAGVGRIEVRNKEDRAARITEEVRAILERGRISAAEAESLRGTLNFARAQTFGRCGASSLHYLSAAARAGGFQIDAQGRHYLGFWLRFSRRLARGWSNSGTLARPP